MQKEERTHIKQKHVIYLFEAVNADEAVNVFDVSLKKVIVFLI
jgi:hypothetical protein